MKTFIIILLGLPIFILSFQKQDKVGKTLFENSCKSCHLPNKGTEIAPSFQNIRKDYGLKWTLDFIKDSRKLRDQADIKALYSYYLFGKIKHTSFPLLEPEYVIKILDYVDSFSVDTSQFKHRLVNYKNKRAFVQKAILTDTLVNNVHSMYIDTLASPNDDTLTPSLLKTRQSSRRYNSGSKHD